MELDRTAASEATAQRRARAAAAGRPCSTFFFSRRRRHTSSLRDWSSDVCSSDLAAAADPDRWARNVTALAAVQPADLGPSEISVKLGAPWVPAGDVQAFLADTLGDGVEVRHQPLVATWEVRAPWGGREGAAASAQWGTGRVDAYRLAEVALNGGAP